MELATSAPQREDETAEMGWQVVYGHRIGQRDIEAGVVLAFEPDMDKATRAFVKKEREFLHQVDSRVNVPGTILSLEQRTGKYVAANWVRRAR